MEHIIIHNKPDTKVKNYIAGLGYCYDSVYDLVSALFATYQKQTEDYENIRLLLETLGYTNLNQIKPEEMDSVRSIIRQKIPEWNIEKDVEYRNYLLLSALMKKEVLLLIDNNVITNPDQKIYIEDDSTISFINNLRLSQIQFETI